MEKIMLVDGHNLLFQMFLGMPSRIIGRDGTSIHGVVGFVGALLKTIRSLEITKVIVIFDGENGSDKGLLDSGYKANRTDYTDAPDEINPFSQLPYIKRALDFMGIKHFETDEGYETDDIISAYCKKYPDTADIFIFSHDSDYFQLVNERISVFKYRGKKSELIGEKEVFDKFGVMPNQMIDFKALVGDRADNIRGVPKIGLKTAQRLLNEYGCLKNIINELANIKPTHIQAALRENMELLERNTKIIGLTGTACLPLRFEDVAVICNTHDFKTMDILKGIEIVN